MSKLSSSKSDFKLFCVSNAWLYSWGWLREYHLDKNCTEAVVTINGFVKSSPASFSFDEFRAAVTDQYNCTQLMQVCQGTYGADYNYIYSVPADGNSNIWYGVVDVNGEHCPHSLSLLTKFKFSEDF